MSWACKNCRFTEVWKLAISKQRFLEHHFKQLHMLFWCVSTLSFGRTPNLSPLDERKFVRMLRNHQDCHELENGGKFCIAIYWEAANQERNSCFKIKTFKLNWNLQLPSWTSQMPSREKFFGFMDMADKDWAVWLQWQEICLGDCTNSAKKTS